MIATEDIEMSSLFDDESEADARGTVAWLSRISREDLKVKKSMKSPEAVLEHSGIQAQWISLVMLATGFVIWVWMGVEERAQMEGRSLPQDFGGNSRAQLVDETFREERRETQS